MRFQDLRFVAAGMIAALFMLGSAAAQDVKQVLDRVHVFGDEFVLEMNFDDPARIADFSMVLDEPGSQFSACKLTAAKGLWCLDGKNVVNWPNPKNPLTSNVVLNCEDPTLDLDPKKDNTCTGMTVDSLGSIYLAGKNKGRTHSLLKIVAADSGGICPAGYAALANSPAYCSALLATGRPLLVDILPIDGDSADEFNPGCAGCSGSGKGTLGVEERKTVVFFPDSGPAVEIAGGRDWGLSGNEQLMSAALMQLPNTSDGFDSFVLATTTKGRILAVETDGTPDARQLFDIEAARSTSSTECSLEDQNYGIRASAKSGVAYVTDRKYCQVLALEPVITGGQFTALANVQESGSDLTLATADASGTFSPTGPTLAPGIVIDLTQCAFECTLVNSETGGSAATLANVSLVGTESDMTLFQIQGMPDCRYVPDACIALLDGVNSKADLFAAGIIVDPSGSDIAAAQVLNVTPLFPSEITDLFPDGLPNLWISRWYRGQAANGYLFDAFFGFTEASFTDVFDLELEVAELTGGGELGCPTVTPPTNTPVAQLLQWDVAIKVSERFISIDRADIPDTDVHETTLINTGCGSTRTAGERWSLVPFNMEVTPDTWDGITTTAADDAVFARLLIALVNDLGDTIDQLACQAVDGDTQTFAPLSISQCSSLQSQWVNTYDKLYKCIDATKEPKSSSRNQNCQAFESQLGNFAADLEALMASGQDPANRVGELRVRLRVIENLYYNLFFPSIPDEGFAGF